MDEKIVTVGDTRVQITETEDGFEAAAIGDEPEEKIRQWAEETGFDGRWFVKPPAGDHADFVAVFEGGIPKAKPKHLEVPECVEITGLREKTMGDGITVYFDETE